MSATDTLYGVPVRGSSWTELPVVPWPVTPWALELAGSCSLVAGTPLFPHWFEGTCAPESPGDSELPTGVCTVPTGAVAVGVGVVPSPFVTVVVTVGVGGGGVGVTAGVEVTVGVGEGVGVGVAVGLGVCVGVGVGGSS